ncbi:DUF262 domain-containing protein [Rhizobium leguminosarum bv. viciae]|uniref:DUF262 domain-containing protein n=1 Tax=Rhizobium leguminosarum TaxID=384 RepID=UPI0014425C62|nr:DUF262 domain-containing protein [Rhizobium leguminosarum]NKK98646.1 DUF262 domain-containing protein [Rhizobium leguminosarum bv. viciae]
MKNNSTLNLNTVDYPFETLVQRAKANPPKLILDPDFQRKYKWDKEGWARASKFIESCLMRIPLPSCYFAETKDGSHLVIDGVQRITTVLKFFNNEFALEEMSAFPDLEGKKFSELGAYRAELESTTIRCVILRRENPDELVTEIFARLNKGSVSLSDQEIRHALYPGAFDKLLSELAENKIIKDFGLGKEGKGKRDARESEELVLRFFAFFESPETYEGNLSKFLDKYMKTASYYSGDKLEKLKKDFNTALSACLIAFDEDEVFADISRDRRRQGVVYYDLLMTTLGRIKHSVIKKKREAIRSAFIDLCKSDSFKKSTAGGLQRKSSVNKRNSDWNKKLQGAIRD